MANCTRSDAAGSSVGAVRDAATAGLAAGGGASLGRRIPRVPWPGRSWSIS
ncbi:hypothetical protein ACFQU2_00825 [Siccirubricoccus deserti]